MEGVLKEIKILKDKAVRYDNLKERYVEYSKDVLGLKEKFKELEHAFDELIVKIDPFNRRVKSRGRTTRLKPIVKEVHELLIHGTHVSFDTIATAYQNLDKNQVYAILRSLKQINGVQKRVKNKKLYLYIDKEI